MRIPGLALVLLVAGGPASSSAATSPGASVSPLPDSLRQRMSGVSWHAGCPVALDDLRLVRARHWGFDGRARVGRIVVRRDVAPDVASALDRLSSGTTSHRGSRPFLRRAPYRTGMALEGGVVVRAFDAIGWGWGGRWSGVRDYQHVSASGR